MLEIIGSNPIGGSQIPPNNSAAFLLSMEADNLQLNAGVLNNFGQGLYALNGNDTVKGSEDNEVMNGNRDDDLLMGGPGQDFLRGGKGFDKVHGDEGEDIVLGDRQDDFVYGGEGNDLVRGGKDLDFLEGGPGNDEILGDKGADHLIGGPGLDTLTGGNDPNGSGDRAADIFQLATGKGTDIITDFEPGIDFIELPQEVSIDDIQVRMVEQNSIITINATEEELAILNNITPNSLGDSSFVDSSGTIVKSKIDQTRNDSNDEPSEIIEENPVNLLEEWQGRVYKFDGNTDSPSPIDINNNLDNE
ncbi:MAG: hypothetical protein MGG37_20335, partial [Trichodesmium sp. MAG_R01]|nr:hypothetical protein [Trichodesmium sp. MAG_R01]